MLFDECLPFTSVSEGLLVRLKVTPKAAKNRLGDVFHDEGHVHRLKVYVTAVPENGKANEAVIKLLSTLWHLPKSTFRILQGANDTRKTLLVLGNGNELWHQLRGFL